MSDENQTEPVVPGADDASDQEKLSDLESVRWNDEARDKIVADADRVLRDAVAETASTFGGDRWEDAFKSLNELLKNRFIDYEPGPDVRKYAEMIAAGEFE